MLKNDSIVAYQNPNNNGSCSKSIITSENFSQGNDSIAECFSKSSEWSPQMQGVFRLIDLYAQEDYPLLFLGPSGVGKSYFSKLVHRYSRRDKNYGELNTINLTGDLFESQLFGHKKGAFTGAGTDTEGLISKCSGGTLFFDDFQDLGKDSQAKFLGFLGSGKYYRVGDKEVRDVGDVRFIIASNDDLNAKVKENGFKNDLLHRINTLSITIPPLKERTQDVPIYVQSLLPEIAKERNVEKQELTQGALKKLQNYSFPGNVRQLKNILVRASIHAGKDSITEEHILLDSITTTNPFANFNFSKDFSLDEFILSIETDLVKQALISEKGVITKVAEKLGIKRSAIYDRFYSRYKLDIDEYRNK